MIDLIYYPTKHRKNKRELFIESDIKLNYKALIPEAGTHLDVYEETKLIGKVNGTHIELFDTPIPKKQLSFFTWSWVISDSPEQLLSPHMEDDKYLLNGEIVVRVIDRTAVSQNICNIFKKVDTSERFMKLSYDETKVDGIIAFCLLLVDVSKTFHSI